MRRMRWVGRLGLMTGLLAAGSGPVSGQTPDSAGTREALIAARQAEKAKVLQPYRPRRAELLVSQIEQKFLTGQVNWHPFFQSAYAGGGFTLGAGHVSHVSAYNTIDVRGSWTFTNYKRIESEFVAPRLFNRRGTLSVLGGWREATQVGFYGLGSAETSKDDRVNYSFRQPYLGGLLEVRPNRGPLVITGGVELSEWQQRPGHGSKPSVETVYTPETLPGLGASPTYVHTQGGAAFDWRTSPGYTRTGGIYGATLHDFHDTDGTYSFRQVNYEAIQHVPILRDAWVLSLRGEVVTTYGDTEDIPFFMKPALGGGSTLRGFASWRFRDDHSLLLSAEWRALLNNFIEIALFTDAGKVAHRRADLDFEHLKSDVGIGVRIHGPAATPIRIELAKSNEGMAIVFSSRAAF